MTKIRTLEELQQILDDDLIWRKKELITIKSLIVGSSEAVNSCYIRSGITLLYAHWEGFIKNAGSAYLTYVSSQRLKYAEIATNFVAIATKKLLNDARESNKSSIYTQVVDFLVTGLDEKCRFPTEIETKSNLSSSVLKEIIHSLGLDYSYYATKEHLIDETMLASRNSIAHGRYLLIDKDTFVETHQTIIGLLTLFSNQISNAASMKVYRRT